MKKEDIAAELAKLVQERISTAKLDSKDQALTELLLGDCVSILKTRLSTDDVYRAKKRLLRQEEAALAELQQKARAEKQTGTPGITKA